MAKITEGPHYVTPSGDTILQSFHVDHSVPDETVAVDNIEAVATLHVHVNVLHDDGTRSDDFRYVDVDESKAGDNDLVFTELGEFLACTARVAREQFEDYAGLDLTIALTEGGA